MKVLEHQFEMEAEFGKVLVRMKVAMRAWEILTDRSNCWMSILVLHLHVGTHCQDDL